MSREWREKTTTSQHNFAACFCDRTWDQFSLPDDEEFLWKKIAYAIAGPPSSEKDEYPQDKKDQIKLLQTKCIEHSRKQGFSDVCISFLFVHAYKDDKIQLVVPLIRLRRSDGKNPTSSYFIDHTGRVYENWQDFLDANVFNGWWICVPKDADYAFSDDGTVKLTFSDQTKRGKVLEVVDTAASVTGIAASVSTIAGIVLGFVFPPAAVVSVALLIGGAVTGATSGAYATGRSIGTLVDRSQHDESINPFASGEARACWLTTAASAFSVVAMGSSAALSQTAKAGLLASSELRAVCTALNITTLSVNGLGVINGFYEVSKKKEFTSLDVLQLTTSLFFFTHSLVNFKTASTIIKNAQHEAIAAHKSEVARGNRAAFDAIHRGHQEMVEPGRVRVMHGNREFIRQLNKIDNKRDFFKALKVVGLGGNQLNVNQEFVVDPKAFLQMSEKQRLDILKHTNDLQNGSITEAQFYKNVGSISKEYRFRFERQRKQALEKIKEGFKVNSVEDIRIGERAIFHGSEPRDMDRLNQVLTEAGKNYDRDHLEVARAMADKYGCKDVTDFAAVAEYAIRKTNEEATRLKGQTSKPKQLQGVKDVDYFFNKAAEKFLKNVEGFQDKVLQEFRSLGNRCGEANSAGNPRFKTVETATNHYDKHSFFPRIDDNNLPPERYFEIAREMCEGPMKNPKWTQDGNSLFCKFENAKYGAVAIRYDNLNFGTSVIATLMRDGKPIKDPQLIISDPD